MPHLLHFGPLRRGHIEGKYQAIRQTISHDNPSELALTHLPRGRFLRMDVSILSVKVDEIDAHLDFPEDGLPSPAFHQ